MNICDNDHRLYSSEDTESQNLSILNRNTRGIKPSGKFSFSVAVSNRVEKKIQAGDLLIALFFVGARLPLKIFSVNPRPCSLGNSECDKSTMSISWWISHTSPSRICSLHPVYKFWLVGYSENNSATMKQLLNSSISPPKRRILHCC